ncbi:MAG TPA: SusC/RagA family TonB-linked outer membrane protein, partial [Puia sp.]|nr:SusC/RagA family TonB-linked outer membrane protein [Puia sp.]
LIPQTLFAQSAELITLKLDNASLQTIFSAIESQSAYHFIFTGEELKEVRPVTLSVNKVTLHDALKLCFQDQPVFYTIEDHFIIVHKKEKGQVTGLIKISGTVRNEKGDPVSGVGVSIPGTNRGTTTETDGSFFLENVPANVTLIFSGANVETYRITLHDQQIVNVTLKSRISKLDDVQIIAYGTTSKRLTTGNVSSVPASVIAEQPVSNPLAALEGRVAGLVVTEQTGVPGGSFSVQIRGQNSIFNGNNPFYVVDGVPFTSTSINSNIVGYAITEGGSPMNEINPSDIESIEILKDADATAIYGSRGANGVILITTKKGKMGKTTLDLNVNTGVGEVTRMMPLLNTPQYISMREEAFANDGVTPDPVFDHDLTVWDTTRYTNWMNQMIGGRSNIFNLQVGLSGGNASTQFILGASYFGTTTVFPGDYSDKKISTHFGLTHMSADKKFQLTFSGNYVVDQNSLPQIDPTGPAFSLPPDAPDPLTPDGKLNWQNGLYGDNPYQLLYLPYHANSTNLIGNATMGYEIVSGITIKANLGYTKMQVDESSATPVYAVNPAYGQTTGTASFASHNISSWIMEPQLEYKKKETFGNIDLLAGLTFQQSLNQGQTLLATGYTNDALLGNIAGASNILVENSTYNLYHYEAFFARINYNWQEKYLVNITGRRDGSSRFGEGKQFADFGAIGAAWIFSKENGLKDIFPSLSFGKLRGSYGIAGNDQIGDYQFLETWSPVDYPYQGVLGLHPSNLANPDYSWETNKKTEIALDLGFWNDRLLFSAAYFVNHSANQLIYYPLPGITGFSLIAENSTAMVQNTGIEMELNTINIKSANFSWTTSFNISVPKNKLVSYPNLAGSPFAHKYVIGQPLSIVQAFHYTGVDPASGLYVFESKDPNNPVYPDDLHAIKNTSPVFYGGLQNTLAYKKWKFEFFFQFVKQDGYNYLMSNPIEPGMYGNQPTVVMNRWQHPGQLAPVEKFSQDYGPAYNAYNNLVYSSDGNISDASFIRLKNLSLSYSFSGLWFSRMKMQNARIYLQGQNLLTITHYLGMDPENQSNSILPPLKIVTAGFQCSF